MMTKNIILGGGLTALIARDILGSNWSIIPIAKSRFYTYKPALDDNHILKDDRTDDYVKYLGGGIPFLYKTAYSFEGQLYNYQQQLANLWLSKVYGENIPPQSNAVMSTRKHYFIYSIKANELYTNLMTKYASDIANSLTLGKPNKIENKTIYTDTQAIEYDNIISTIPYEALTKYLNIKYDKQTIPTYYYHIKTDTLDLEGNSEVLICDHQIEFYKVRQLTPDRYLFYCNHELDMPGQYFMQFMPRYDLLDGTRIIDAIPCGIKPNLKHIEDKQIYCVGKHAQVDPYMCIGSSIKRLLDIKDLGL